MEHSPSSQANSNSEIPRLL